MYPRRRDALIKCFRFELSFRSSIELLESGDPGKSRCTFIVARIGRIAIHILKHVCADNAQGNNINYHNRFPSTLLRTRYQVVAKGDLQDNVPSPSYSLSRR